MTTSMYPNNWGGKRNQEERKNNLAKAGQMALASPTSASSMQANFNNDYMTRRGPNATYGESSTNYPNDLSKTASRLLKGGQDPSLYPSGGNAGYREDKSKTNGFSMTQDYSRNNHMNGQSSQGFALPGIKNSTKPQTLTLGDDEFSPNNVPSRWGKNVISPTKKGGYDYEFDQRPKEKPGKLLTGANPYDGYAYDARTEQPEQQNYQQYTQEKLPPNLLQKNKQADPIMTKPHMNLKNGANSKQNYYEEKDDTTKFFSKPAFTKKTEKIEKPLPPKPKPLEEVPIAKLKQTAPIINYDEDEDDGFLEECPHGCGRSFKRKALDKHAKVCIKVFQSKRKEFDITAYRSEEGAMAQPEPKATKKGQKAAAPAPEKFDPNATDSKGKWKQQSEAFRATMKAAKGVELTETEKTAVAQANDAGMILCKGCGRKFNEKAAAKHLPFCEGKQKDMKKGAKGKK